MIDPRALSAVRRRIWAGGPCGHLDSFRRPKSSILARGSIRCESMAVYPLCVPRSLQLRTQAEEQQQAPGKGERPFRTLARIDSPFAEFCCCWDPRSSRRPSEQASNESVSIPPLRLDLVSCPIPLAALLPRRHDTNEHSIVLQGLFSEPHSNGCVCYFGWLLRPGRCRAQLLAGQPTHAAAARCSRHRACFRSPVRPSSFACAYWIGRWRRPGMLRSIRSLSASI